MKRFLLFSGLKAYPNGGFADFIGDYDTIEDAKSANDSQHLKYYEKYKDVQTKEEFLIKQKIGTWTHIWDSVKEVAHIENIETLEWKTFKKSDFLYVFG